MFHALSRCRCGRLPHCALRELDIVGPLYASKTEFGKKFRDVVASEGVPVTVRWRAAQLPE